MFGVICVHMVSMASPLKIEDYKLCEECGKPSPKGLQYDMDEVREKRKWRCNKCHWKTR